MYKVTFNNKNKVFFNTLKASVDKYFEDNNLKKTGNWRLYLKTHNYDSTMERTSAILNYKSQITNPKQVPNSNFKLPKCP
jgi:hypothetical protein